MAAPIEEETEQFVPTVKASLFASLASSSSLWSFKMTTMIKQIQVRTFATTTPRPTTRRTTTTPEPVDDFEDFFDSGNDLFVASSTVSPVVFKGSPTPGGWASSPAPNFDGSGVQVVYL